MNHIQDIIRRLQLGESERRIARDMKISRATVHKYFEIAKEKGYLENPGNRPNDSDLKEALGPGVQTPRQASTVEPYREAVQENERPRPILLALHILCQSVVPDLRNPGILQTVETL